MPAIKLAHALGTSVEQLFWVEAWPRSNSFGRSCSETALLAESGQSAFGRADFARSGIT
jgi:hypothetical protein